MENKILQLVLLFFLCQGCSNFLDCDKSNTSKYLDKAKACYSSVNPLASKDLMLSKDLQDKLSSINVEDYMGEIASKYGDLTIQFQKNRENDKFFIDITISPSEGTGCESIFVHEVLQ